MTTIAQRQLRNEVSDVLRRAESGERFTITVSGRAVAELGPMSGGRRAAEPDRLAAVLADAPVDATWAAELIAQRSAEAGAAPDPWGA